jgi:hypothetical protein
VADSHERQGGFGVAWLSRVSTLRSVAERTSAAALGWPRSRPRRLGGARAPSDLTRGPVHPTKAGQSVTSNSMTKTMSAQQREEER